MKEIGQMTLWELQKMVDDSLFSTELAWMPSQIHMREHLRKEIYDRRTGKRVYATAELGSFAT